VHPKRQVPFLSYTYLVYLRNNVVVLLHEIQFTVVRCCIHLVWPTAKMSGKTVSEVWLSDNEQYKIISKHLFRATISISWIILFHDMTFRDLTIMDMFVATYIHDFQIIRKIIKLNRVQIFCLDLTFVVWPLPTAMKSLTNKTGWYFQWRVWPTLWPSSEQRDGVRLGRPSPGN